MWSDTIEILKIDFKTDRNDGCHGHIGASDGFFGLLILKININIILMLKSALPWLLSAAAAIALAAPDESESGTDEATDTVWLTRSEAAADLRDWAAHVCAVHPMGGSDSARLQLERDVESTLDALPIAIDARSFHARWAALAASLHDSHTSVAAPPEFSTHPPLPTIAKDGEICLTAAVSGVPRGSCFSSFGFVRNDTVAKWIAKTASAETADGWETQVGRLLPLALTNLDVAPGSMSLLRRPDGKPVWIALPRLGELEPSPPEDAISFGIGEDGFARIDVRTFDGEHAEYFEEAFDHVFGALADAGARGLIVDVRGNDGGSTRVVESFLDHLTTTPYRLTGEKLWQVSAQVQDDLMSSPDDLGNPYLELQPGDVMRTSISLHEPTAQEHRFTGPVLFLSDRRTRSAAMMMLDAVKTFRIGMIVGAAPASPPNYFGEVYRYVARHSGLRVSISSAAFIRANGDALDHTRIEPDIELETDDPDVALTRAAGILKLWSSKVAARSQGVDEGV